ncbi:RNA polymerase sigma factor [Nannocystis bainbridge]|uniref:Sigma-70 family RNA polymerase sigma factor n=1 Tax=Nannocystis bainbridge TaxID=2995303 RepID=A0ABT5E4T4_9BACT|nr:sigma-70 family RNA polymerase sigma factor [Nannocystis bainbridge]MDC0720877.1 sigma-70 family RNA polymerase sigma factor [Nannocystis bainbridge]
MSHTSKTTTRSDLELLDAWRGGDALAGEVLFERHFESVYRFFCNKVPRDADDLVQETFLGCVSAKERFRQDASFRTFLFAIARKVLLKYRERWAPKDEGEELHASRVADLDLSVTQIVVESEEQALLLRALRRLPLDLQTALELFYWEGLLSREIAQVLEIPEGTVRSRLRRGREMLRGIITELAARPELRASTLGDFDQWLASIQGRSADDLEDLVDDEGGRPPEADASGE